MKTSSDDIFKIIKSLTGNEKRLFKIFSQLKKDSIYIKLFDAIDSLEEYDEKKLLKLFAKSLKATAFKHTKCYLLESIVTFLEYHHFDYSVEIQVQRQLQLIEVLYGKRLFSIAEKHLLKAEKIAIEHHLYLYLLLLLSWKQKIILAEVNLAGIKEHKKDYLNVLKYMDSYRNLVEYTNINMQVSEVIVSNFQNADEKRKIELIAILNNPYLKEEKMATSPVSQYIYFRTLGYLHFMLKNREESYVYFKKAFSCLVPLNITVIEKLTFYANFIMLLAGLKKEKEILVLKNEAERVVQCIPPKQQTNFLYNSYLIGINNYISYLLSAFKIKVALSESNKILEKVNKYASPQGIVVYYANRISIFFYMKDYHNALSFANKVLLCEKKGIREDIIFCTKMLYLIINYELENEELLVSLCKAYSREFKNNSNKLEHVLLNFFKKKNSINTKKQKNVSIFLRLKQELEPHKKENIFNQFDFISWAESKIKNRPMIEILREKVKGFKSLRV